VTLGILTKILGGSGYEGAYSQVLSGPQSSLNLNFYSLQIPITHSAEFQIEQTAGVVRSFDWEIIQL